MGRYEHWISHGKIAPVVYFKIFELNVNTVR
jgi:hypothetical protein